MPKKPKKTSKKSGYKKLFIALKIVGIALSVFLFLFAFAFIYFAKDLPRPEKFTEVPFPMPTRIYDRTGKVLLYEVYGEERRELVKIADISPTLINAVIAAEDANFYKHFGIDIKALLRATINNIKKRRFAEGASTITQQLIRTTFLTRDKTPTRKIREIILTLELERRYPKEQILEWYLNQVPLGPNIYGVQTASKTYFGKDAKDLTIPEAAIIAALIRAPSYLYPYGNHLNELLERKDYVIDRMVEVGYISQQDAQKYKEEKIVFQERKQNILAPHFTLMVLDYITQKYGEEFLQTKGLKVITTLDYDLQKYIEDVVKEDSERLKMYNAHNVSVVVINPKDGSIEALLGSKDYFGEKYPPDCQEGLNCAFDPKVNVATFGFGRQTGSAIKPLYYVLAFEKGLSPESEIWDIPTEFNPNCHFLGIEIKDKYGLDCYHPQNFDGRFRGKITIRSALGQSLNIPSTKLFYLVGYQDFYNFAKKAGITTITKNISNAGLSVALGSLEVKLIDLVAAYSVFAANGTKTTPYFIKEIKDINGDIIEKTNISKRKIISEDSVKLLNSVLSDNNARAPVFGLNSALYFKDYPVAAKTGTTQNFEDALAIMYTPTSVLGVWVGNNNHEKMAKKAGVFYAGNIAHKIMGKLLETRKPEPFDFNVKSQKRVIKIPEDNPHTILYYVSKNNFNEPPENPRNDPQFKNWEESLKFWLNQKKF